MTPLPASSLDECKTFLSAYKPVVVTDRTSRTKAITTSQKAKGPSSGSDGTSLPTTPSKPTITQTQKVVCFGALSFICFHILSVVLHSPRVTTLYLRDRPVSKRLPLRNERDFLADFAICNRMASRREAKE